MSAHVVSTGVLAAHWLLALGLSLRVVLRRPPMGVSMAWIAVMFSVPFAGAVAYLLFGEKRLGRERSMRTAKALPVWRERLARLPASLPASSLREREHGLATQIERVLGFPVQSGNTAQLIDHFESFFDALVADIDAATETCDLSFYIWHDGGRVDDVLAALIRAAGRGVRVRVLADALGSEPFLKGRAARRLEDAGIHLVVALPTGPVRTLFARGDLRNHRKIVSIDRRVAYTGSQNLVDPRYFKQSAGVGQWVDAMVRLVGPVAVGLAETFALDWAVETGMRLQSVREEAITTGIDRPGSMALQIAPSGPDIAPEAIHQLLLGAIYDARRELVMTTPYFVPDESILTAMLSAAWRGVSVTLIVPARNDSRLVRQASVAHFDQLLAAGVKIALFKGGLLHTKSLTVDGEFAVFGSVNLDMRSVYLNFEISLFAYDPALTDRLRTLQYSYLEDSTLLVSEPWQHRPIWRRVVEGVARLLGPLL